MAVNLRFYQSNNKYGHEVCLSKNLNNGTITDRDAELMREYVKDIQGNKDLTESTVNLIFDRLICMRKFITVPYDSLTLEDLKEGRRALNNALNIRGVPYSQNTRRDMLKRVKAFAKWLSKKGYIARIAKDDLDDIEVPETNFECDSPDDLFTFDDVKAMLNCCHNSRDRAFIITLYETGARPQEIASITWGDVTLTKHDAKVIVTDAKKRTLKRTAYIVHSLPYLRAYRTDRGDVKPGEFVFIDRSGKAMTWDACRKILTSTMTKAEIKKPMKLKLFRKSRITNMSKENYNESVIRDQIWANQGTQMFKHYLKWKDEDKRKEVHRHNGIETNDDEKPIINKPMTCHKCGTISRINAQYCESCSEALTDDAREQKKSFVDEIEAEIVRRQQDADQKIKEQEQRLKQLEETIAKLSRN